MVSRPPDEESSPVLNFRVLPTCASGRRRACRAALRAVLGVPP